jgi:hypothetical protein
MMAHNPQTALRAWDAELLDGVKVNMNVKTEIVHIDDPLASYGAIASIPGQTQVIATVSDAPRPYRDKRFHPIKIMIRPDSLIYYVQEMNPDNPGQYRPYTLFEAMYIDYGTPKYSIKRNYMTGEYILGWDHLGHWETDGKWYLVYPEFMTVNQESDSRSMSLW